MKKTILLIMAINIYCLTHAQNVGIGTISPAGKLHIKGSADTSQLTIDGNATQSNVHPLIRLRNAAGTDILHINSDDISNTFIGGYAGRSNTVISGGGAVYNTFIGSFAGYSNKSGGANTANGALALYSNTNGYENTGMGGYALYSNTTGTSNAASGANTLYNNTTGTSNTATGTDALYSNTTGNWNTAGGASALISNITGSYNTAFGAGALSQTKASLYNTAIGYQAGDTWDNGYNNVFVGANVDVNGPGYYNVIAIGQGTTVGGSSVAVFGNSATAAYYGYANWTNISDGRYKKNIKENVPGLDFIKKLRPITYNLKATELDAFLHRNDSKQRKMNDAAMASHNKALQEKEAITYTGFSAQEVEVAAKELGFNFSGVDAPKNENGVYGLRYADFAAPLVKAVQEQQQMIEELKKQNASLERRIAELEKRSK
jgi:hypothetical protein